MIKQICLISLSLIIITSGSLYAKAAKNIFITPFSIHGGGTSSDFTDYMSEVIVDYKDYNLISDEEVSRQREAIERKMSAAVVDDNDVKEIMKMVDSDCIIYGSISNDAESNIVISAVLLDRTSSSVRKTITIKRDRYLDSAAHAMAHYLLTKKESYIKKFMIYMEDKEEEILSDEIERLNALTGVETDFEGKNASIKNSPFIRIGYGGFFNTSIFSDEDVNEYYPEGQTFIADLFIYRSRDFVGDGVDIYSRFFYRKYKADDKAYSKISEEMTEAGAGDYDNIAGKYDPIPQDDLEMIQKGIDVGLRFAGTTYFWNEAWSFYFMFGGRYMAVTEEYTAADIEYKKNLSGTGGTGAIGFEVTLNRYLGLFSEINAGYVPLGDNDKNYDGIQFLVGVTYRTNHVEGPLLGFL